MQQVDPQEHGGLLSQFGIDPQQLASGGYQHLGAQQQGGEFGQQGGGYDDQQQGGYDNQR